MSRFPTCYPSLDAVTGGIAPGELELRAASVGHGKTGDALKMTAELASHGLAMYLHAEEDSVEVASRMGLTSGGVHAERADRVLIHQFRFHEVGIIDLARSYYGLVDRHLSTGTPMAAVTVDYVNAITRRWDPQECAVALQVMRAVANGDLSSVEELSGEPWPHHLGPKPQGVPEVAVIAYCSTNKLPAHEPLRDRLTVPATLGVVTRYIELRRDDPAAAIRPGDPLEVNSQFIVHGVSCDESSKVAIPMIWGAEPGTRRGNYFDPATVTV